ncbi:hypothetical protein [Achromobacter ruhlandii]|uniref:Uncharacterized protein n=1 Tax=Achromobacter ruhlandii TaxID=72557 RepID=A0A6S7ENU3_9BURK|nr:hypothetical protein [Achromobacter ruhlandii]CAB3919982.1 hypothetical protein LMG3328_05306 [Achromobacter ruhlandii]
MIRRLLRNLLQIDAHTAVGIFSIICAIVGVLASLQQGDEASNQQWAKDSGTKYAAKE